MDILMTEKQKEVMWKKRRILELRDMGLSYSQIDKKFNTELSEKGYKNVCLGYSKRICNMIIKQR